MGRITHIGSYRRNRTSLHPEYLSLLGDVGKFITGAAHTVSNAVGDVVHGAGSAVSAVEHTAAPVVGDIYRATGGPPPASPSPHSARPLVSLVSPLSSLFGGAPGLSGLPPALATALSTETPTTKVPGPLEKRTVGAPSLSELLAAASKTPGADGLRLTDSGKITTPGVRDSLHSLAATRAQLARTTGLTGPLTPGQKVFAQQVARETGLSPRVVGAQALAEESGSYAQQRQAEGNNNWLNIGYFDSGPGAITQGSRWGDPHRAAHSTSEFLKGRWGGASSGIQNILASADASPQQQIQAIGTSGWASNPAYAQSIAGTYGLVGERHNPQARAAFHDAAQHARSLGLNPTPFNGDVERGPAPKTVFVRADAQGMVHWAQSAVGTAEGSPKQVRWAGSEGLSGSQPWCANFISNGLARRGVALPPNPNYVPSYEREWSGGRNIGTDLRHAKPGDLIAFSGQHIGLYVGHGEMVSGNFGNEVARSSVSDGPAPVSAILRPSYKGGRVAVHESAPLPGSTSALAFAGDPASGSSVAAAQALLAQQRQAMPLTPLTSPLAAALPTTGPVLPTADGGQEGPGSASAEELLALLARHRRGSIL